MEEGWGEGWGSWGVVEWVCAGGWGGGGEAVVSIGLWQLQRADSRGG